MPVISKRKEVIRLTPIHNLQIMCQWMNID
jgi:hypothetical protein